ncbi:MAG: hypothetical protein ACT6S0_26865, partial [Roseateles sp.]|uniref:hypothetical protein n=1 Tax=Roseateles sp. TaxID=1971397 RepID=UPI0040365033
MSTLYTPTKGALPWKVIEFLTTNPTETLTVDDISVKFDVPVRGLAVLLTPAVESGALVRLDDAEEDEMVYRLGKGHPQIKARPSIHPSLGPVGTALTKKKRQRVLIDTSKIEIKSGVPIPQGARNGRTNWTALFDRMKKDDCAELPLSSRGSIQKCVNEYSKATSKAFTIRRIDDETLGLWRVS